MGHRSTFANPIRITNHLDPTQFLPLRGTNVEPRWKDDLPARHIWSWRFVRMFLGDAKTKLRWRWRWTSYQDNCHTMSVQNNTSMSASDISKAIKAGKQ